MVRHVDAIWVTSHISVKDMDPVKSYLFLMLKPRARAWNKFPVITETNRNAIWFA